MCKAFLEPGLDSVWYSIDSFEAIVAPFTKSRWRKEEFDHSLTYVGYEPSILFHIEGPLEPSDLERYTKYYAPRIREILIDLYPGVAMMSLETCEALSLATNHQSGNLSPLLRRFAWRTDFREVERIYGQRFIVDVAPYLALFMGGSTRSVTYKSWASRLPIEAGTIQSISANMTRLRDMVLQTRDSNLIHGILTSSSWNHLEKLVVETLSGADIPHAGSLPQLSNLHIM
ncbi:hypothetical protein FA13DRAFT_798685 [Coprinellus micaceus]|uniref:Uncharacterized protein n=1 Tax=Coprinellus micaceus TaxID=71717 RepID=A0A4Y7S691_COPMI|nr:hypothetical protein FA13DRAFT_798685 [Coprinellus micaceus]